MNRNVARQIAPERGVDIRMPSTALLGTSSYDRYANKGVRAFTPTTPFSVLLTSKQNFLSGFFTRVALTEVRVPWFLPTITNRNNQIGMVYKVGGVGVATYYNMTIPSGWYTPTTLASAVQTAIRQVPANANGNQGSGKTGFTVAYSAATFSFTAATNNTDTFHFIPQNAIATNGESTGLYEMMNWISNITGTTDTPTQISGVPSMISTQFIDIECAQLTYAQDVKDGDTGKTTRDIVARIYLAPEGTSDPTALGSSPFVLYRQFQTPKQIKWDNSIPIGQMQFTLYDDAGVQLGTYGTTQTINAGTGAVTVNPASDNDNAMGDWSITLLVSEV